MAAAPFRLPKPAARTPGGPARCRLRVQQRSSGRPRHGTGVGAVGRRDAAGVGSAGCACRRCWPAARATSIPALVMPGAPTWHQLKVWGASQRSSAKAVGAGARGTGLQHPDCRPCARLRRQLNGWSGRPDGVRPEAESPTPVINTSAVIGEDGFDPRALRWARPTDLKLRLSHRLQVCRALAAPLNKVLAEGVMPDEYRTLYLLKHSKSGERLDPSNPRRPPRHQHRTATTARGCAAPVQAAGGCATEAAAGLCACTCPCCQADLYANCATGGCWCHTWPRGLGDAELRPRSRRTV